jgi:hypothetical protein
MGGARGLRRLAVLLGATLLWADPGFAQTPAACDRAISGNADNLAAPSRGDTASGPPPPNQTGPPPPKGQGSLP